MIKNINAGAGLSIQNGHSTWPSFYNNSASNSNTLVGQMRYNGSAQCIEVYDGMVWLSMSTSFPTIELNGDVQLILNWARMKMSEEARIRELAAKHPAVADALAAVEKAQEQARVVIALVDTE